MGGVKHVENDLKKHKNSTTNNKQFEFYIYCKRNGACHGAQRENKLALQTEKKVK